MDTYEATVIFNNGKEGIVRHIPPEIFKKIIKNKKEFANNPNFIFSVEYEGEILDVHLNEIERVRGYNNLF